MYKNDHAFHQLDCQSTLTEDILTCTIILRET